MAISGNNGSFKALCDGVLTEVSNPSLSPIMTNNGRFWQESSPQGAESLGLGRLEPAIIVNNRRYCALLASIMCRVSQSGS